MALFKSIIDAFSPDQESDEWKKKEIDTMRKIAEAYSVNMVLTDQKFPQADRMYEGLHWEEKIDGVAYTRLENFSKLVYNFCADTVDRWTSFIGGTPPMVAVKPYSEISVAEDVSEAGNDYEGETDEIEAVNKIVWNMLRSNNWRTLFLTLANVQSKYGRPIIYVYFPNKDVPYPVFEILRPHDSFPVFDSRNYKDLFYIVGRKSIDFEKAKLDYPDKANLITPDAIDVLKSTDQQRPRVTVFRYLDDKEMRLYMSNMLVQVIEHGYGKVPVFIGQNRNIPFSAFSKNDIESIYKDNKAFNLTYSNLVDVTEDHAIGKRLIRKPGQATDMNKLMDRQQRHVTIGPETEIQDLHPDVKISEMKFTLDAIRMNIEDQTGITELLKGRFSGSIATGVALSGLSRGIEDLARQKIMNLSEQLEEAINFGLYLLKKFRVTEPTSGKLYSEILKRDRYFMDFIWDSATIQDYRLKATTNIDLVNTGLKSRVSAMKDLKIEYPEDEQTRVSYETMNPMINPKLAMEMAAMNQGKQSYSSDQEEFKSKQENAKLLRGNEVEVTETEPGQHMIHLRNHKGVESMARGKAKSVLSKHIAQHEQKSSAPGVSPPMPSAGAAQPAPPQTPMGMPGIPEQARPMAQPGVPNPGNPMM